MSDKKFNLSIQINGKEVKNTLNGVGKELKALRSQERNLTQGTDEWHEKIKELSKTEKIYDEMKKNQRELINETKKSISATEDQVSAMDDFSQSFTDAFEGLKNGDMVQFRQGMHGVATGIKGATKAAISFIATPIGAALAALTGIAVAAGAWFKYNDAALEALKLTQQITGLSDQAADQARIRAEVLTETFGGELKNNLETARNLVQQFGISYEKAFDVIESQLVRGQGKNDEFFDSLKEYPTFFAQAKFSAEEFARVIATGANLGIYKDKLPDAIKEADLALREQTKTTKDALINAFGAPFTDEILTKIKNGEISTKDALKAISAEADKQNINIQQNAQLTADLFKGAGEDAGGALKVFQALNVALNEQQKPLTESEKLLEEQTKTTRELKEVSSALFFTGDKGFGLLIDKAKLFGTKVLVQILRAGVDVINWFIDLNNESRVFSGIMATFGKVATVGFEIIDSLISNAKKQFSGLGDIILGVFSLDEERVKAGLAKTASATAGFFQDLKNKAIQAGEDISKAFSGENQMEKITIGSYTENSENSNSEDSEDSIEKEVEKRTNEEKIIRQRVKSVMDEWENDNKVEIDKDPLEKAQEVVDRNLEFLEKQQEDELRIKGATEEQITELKKRHGNDRIKLEGFFAKQEQKINEQKVKWNELTEEQKLQTIVGALSSASEAFTKGSAAWKATKIAETTIATYQGAQNAYTALAGIPVVGPALGAAAAAAAIVSGLKQVQQISNTQIPKPPNPRSSFAKGGYTDLFGMGYKDETGEEVAGVVHKDEYVVPRFVREEPGVPAILEFLETKRKRKLGLYADGGDTSSDSIKNPDPQGVNPLGNSKRIEGLLQNILDASLENRTILFGFEAEQKRQEAEKKLNKIKERSTIKKQ